MTDEKEMMAELLEMAAKKVTKEKELVKSRTRYLEWPAPRPRRFRHGPTQLERCRGTHRPQRTSFLASPQEREQVDTFHRVAHVDEGVKATRRAQHVDHAGHNAARRAQQQRYELPCVDSLVN